MEEHQFEELIEEFRLMREENTKAIGMGGLGAIQRRGMGSNLTRQQQQRGGRPGHFPNRNGQESGGMSRSNIEDLKSNTYRVNITNSITGFVDPLHNRMEALQISNQQFQNDLHHDSSIKLSTIIALLRDANTERKPTLVSAMRNQYDMFMASPLFNSLRLMNRYIVTPMFRMASSVLFGAGPKSEEAKTRKAIEDQTKFMRTGEIGGRGFFQRMIQGGLIGAIGRGILSGSGMGTGAAQRREDARARGEFVDSRWFTPRGLQGIITDAMASEDITRRGRGGRGEVPEETDQHYDWVEQSLRLMNQQVRKLVDRPPVLEQPRLEQQERQQTSIQFDPIIEGQYQVKEELRSIGSILSDQSIDVKQRTGHMSELLTSMNRSTEQTKEYVGATFTHHQRASHAEFLDREETRDWNKLSQETQENQLGILQTMRRDTRITARENRRQSRQGFMRIITGIGSAVASIATSFIGLATRIGMAVAAAIAARGLLPRGGRGGVGMGGTSGRPPTSGSTQPGRTGRISGATSAVGDFLRRNAPAAGRVAGRAVGPATVGFAGYEAFQRGRDFFSGRNTAMSRLDEFDDQRVNEPGLRNLIPGMSRPREQEDQTNLFSRMTSRVSDTVSGSFEAVSDRVSSITSDFADKFRRDDQNNEETRELMQEEISVMRDIADNIRKFREESKQRPEEDSSDNSEMINRMTRHLTGR